MTTITMDRLDAGEHISAYQIRDEAARLDGAATDTPALTAAQILGLAEQVERLGRENAELRAAMGSWVPQQSSLRNRHLLDSAPHTPREVHSVDDLTDTQRHRAMVAPTPQVDGDGMALTPFGDDGVWPTWLDEVHRAEATWADSIAGLRGWADTYAARDIERTVVQPVEVDTSYRETDAALYADMVVSLYERRSETVYSELAPDRIAAESGPPHRLPPPPPADRSGLDKLVKRVPTALSASVSAASEASPEPAQKPMPRWRRYGDLIAGAAVGLAAFAALGLTIWLTGGP